jgi:hypothetical protein
VTPLARRVAALLLLTLLMPTRGSGRISPGVTEIEVRVAAGRPVWRAPIAAGEPFELAFTHSVERSRWVHHYTAAPGAVEQRGSTFVAFGAGMPAWGAGGEALLLTPDGYYAPAPMRIPILRMLNSRTAGLTLRHRGRLVPIGDLLDDFEAFEIRIR